jgi:putative tricarboxylic transport membrane protein
MGVFGISEVLINLEEVVRRDIFKAKIEGLLPNREEWRRSSKPILRGTILGFF